MLRSYMHDGSLTRCMELLKSNIALVLMKTVLAWTYLKGADELKMYRD